MITSKIMYQTEDGQLFGSHEDAIIHDQKLRKQKENQIKREKEMWEEGRKLQLLFDERLTLLKEAIEAVKKYKETDRQYMDKKFEFNEKYGDLGGTDFVIYDFEVTPTESDLFNAM